MRIIKTIAELDDILKELDSAAKVSDDELRKLFDTFKMEFNTLVPKDPYSKEYSDFQFEIYSKISGKKYCIENEISDFDLDAITKKPFPYCCSCTTAGSHFSLIAQAISVMNLKPNSRVIELGAGWGNITLILSMMGHDVTVIEINPKFCTLIGRRAGQVGTKIDIINDDFSYIEKVDRPADAILFFESFHHTSDHVRIIKGLDKATTRGGKVFFASEPITDDFPIPWGIRLDGQSLWSIRNFGWYEIGFNTRYFVRTLSKFGWSAHKNTTVWEASKTNA